MSGRAVDWDAWDKAEFEATPHEHEHPLSKGELAAHLLVPHKQRQREGWLSNAGPLRDLSKWRLDELERTHLEYHEGG